MGFFIKKDEWKQWISEHKEMSEFFGIKNPFRSGKETNLFNTLFYKEGTDSGQGQYSEDVISVNWLYHAVWRIYLRLKKMEETTTPVDKLTERLDELSGWLASKELQQVLSAKVKSLEETVAELEKKLAKIEKKG